MLISPCHRDDRTVSKPQPVFPKEVSVRIEALLSGSLLNSTQLFKIFGKSFTALENEALSRFAVFFFFTRDKHAHSLGGHTGGGDGLGMRWRAAKSGPRASFAKGVILLNSLSCSCVTSPIPSTPVPPFFPCKSKHTIKLTAVTATHRWPL